LELKSIELGREQISNKLNESLLDSTIHDYLRLYNEVQAKLNECREQIIPKLDEFRKAEEVFIQDESVYEQMLQPFQKKKKSKK
jgi:hypothetical protein